MSESDNVQTDKWIIVDGATYIIDEETGTDLADILAHVRGALTDRTVATVRVLDARRNRMTLYLNGAATTAVVLDLGEGPKPGEISP